MRKPSVDKNGVKKGAWSEEEDNKLRSYILRYGHWNWRLLPKFAGLARCGKSCRLRWVNYLKPGLKRGSFTKEEENLIAKLHDELGNKWSAMAAIIPGRTDNEIKNFWHTHLKKRGTKLPASAQQPSSSQTTVCKNVISEKDENFRTFNKLILESSRNPAAVVWDSEDSASSSNSAIEVEESMLSIAEKCESRRELNFNIDDKYERASGLSDGFVESFWSQPFVVDTSYSYSHDHTHTFTPLMEEEAAIYLFT